MRGGERKGKGNEKEHESVCKGHGRLQVAFSLANIRSGRTAH